MRPLPPSKTAQPVVACRSPQDMHTTPVQTVQAYLCYLLMRYPLPAAGGCLLRRSCKQALAVARHLHMNETPHRLTGMLPSLTEA